MGAATLIGRDEELGLLLGRVRALAGGNAATVFVEGEAGIGKTRLLGTVAGAASASGVTVLRGTAHPLEQTRPFGPLVDALGVPAGRRLQFQAVEEIIDRIERLTDGGPVLLGLDDLHWADGSTLLAVLWMTRRLTEVPLLLVATLRPSPQAPELSQLLDDAERSGAGILRLPALSAPDVAALVESELGLPPGRTLTDVVGRAGGNPLWVVELLRSLAAEGLLDCTHTHAEMSGGVVPGSVRQLVVRRLAYLPASAVSALRTASVLGDAFSLNDMATITGRRVPDLVDDLGPAFQAQLVADHRGVLVFRHQLVRDAIYGEIPEAARLALHRDAARALSDVGAPLAQVASHLVLGSVAPDLEAARSLRTAAAEASSQAPGVAVELLRRTEELLPTGHADRDPVLAELVENLLRIGRVPEAAAIAEGVLARPHAVEADQPLRLCLIDTLSLLNRAQDLIDLTEATLHASPEMAGAEQAFVLAQSSFGRTFSGDLAGAEVSARRAVALAEQVADPAMTAWSLETLCTALKTQGRFEEAVRCSERAVEVAVTAEDPEARMRGPFFMHGMALCDADRLDDAARAFRTAAEESNALESWWLLPDIQLVSAEVRFLRGEWEAAVPEIEGGIEFAREHGNMITLPRFGAYLALVAALRGDVAAAHRRLAPYASELTNEHPAFGAEFVFYAAAVLAEATDRPEVALGHLGRFVTLEAIRDNHYGDRFIAPTLTRLALAHGEPRLAEAAAGRADEAARLAGDVPSVHSAARRCRGLITSDPEPLLEAVALAARSRRLLLHAGACEDAASVLAADATAAADARRLLEQAIDDYEAIGASWSAARATAQLRGLGGRPGSRGSRRRPQTGWQSLTPSERAVAELVAEGLTNREVAQRLFISPHTVNTHLRHAFQKLDVSTRTGLAARASKITHSSDVSGVPAAQTAAGTDQP
ncbi:MAG: helix-turn-helix transcriptional regulator [Solirubrobacteraceae bacterium]